MATKLFQGLITDEGIEKARDTQTTQGWYISPFEFYLAETSGEFKTSRTTASMKSSWYHGKFSAVTKQDSNKILLTITLAGDEDTVQRQIKEIYIKCKLPDGSEFLYALIQPLISITFVPTVSQEMNFLITLSNTTKEDIYTIQYVDTTKLNSYQLKIEKGQKSGYCPLGADSIVPDSYLPLRDNLPIGTLIPVFCTKNYIPVGYLPCDGKEYTYTEFPAVYNDYLLTSKLPTCTYTEYTNSINSYGSCAKFGLDTANSKFKVPTIADGTTLQQAKSDSQLSVLYKANIATGSSQGAVKLRWFILVTHGLINASLTDWSAWVNQLNSNTSNITAMQEWDIGVPIPMVTNNLPTNYIRLEGASVLISDYPKLWAKYGATWGQADTQHFYLPDFRNRAVWGSNGTGYLNAGLPNIWGEISWNYLHSSRWFASYSALYCGAQQATGGGSGKALVYQTLGFNAQRNNGIYGASSTVQPPAIRVRFITRYK